VLVDPTHGLDDERILDVSTSRLHDERGVTFRTRQGKAQPGRATGRQNAARRDLQAALTLEQRSSSLPESSVGAAKYRWLSERMAGWGGLLLAASWANVAVAEPVSTAVATAPSDEAIAVSEKGAQAAQSLLRQGIEFRKVDDDVRARDAFARAWQLAGSAEALAQLALAEQALGHWTQAHEHLRSALDRASTDSWIAAHVPILEEALGEVASRLGRVEISCNVEGAEVRSDGRVVGTTPIREPVLFPAGRSVVQVSADGYFELTREVRVDVGALARLDVTLTPNVAARGAASARVPISPARSAGESSGPPEPAPVHDAAVPRPEANSARDVLLYGSVGLAGLGLVVGVSGYVMREVNVSLYNDDSRCDTELGPRRSQECPDEAAAWRLGEGLAIGGFAAASIFGALSLYLWLEEPEPTRVALGCAVEPWSVACRLRF